MSSLLDESYPLRSEQVASYQHDGHIMLQGVGTPELAASLRPPLQKAVASIMATKDPQGRIEQYGGMFQQVTNVWRLDPECRKFIFAKRFAKIAADLMGVSGVRLYHDQALFKPPGGKGTPWHQDQVYWPLDTTHTITMWMPLVDVDQITGTMVFASGSHTTGQLVDKVISSESDTFFEELIPQRGYRIASSSLKAGDATFHSGWTAHSAHPNTGTNMREVITIIYYADGTKILQPESKYRQVDMEAFHPGQKPGEVAASELNPLLYKI
jgi:ectoine hydroxylase-related dioxygenase (phytanoyl-CoA dioxygenase family)